MKKILLCLLFLLPFLAKSQSMDEKIQTLTNQLADLAVKSGAKKVAVSTFMYKDCNTEFGKYLAGEMTGYLSISGRSLSIVNQEKLESLMAQNQLTAKGLLEASNEAAKLGSASGIDPLIYGSITTFGEDLKISANIIRLPTLLVLGFGRSSITLTSSIKDMLPCIDTPVARTTTKTAGKPDSPAAKKANIPSMPGDCETKNTCIICVTNSSSAPVKAGLSYYNYPTYYLESNETKCFQNVEIYNNADHLDMEVRYYSDNNTQLKADAFVIKPCKLYERTFTK